MPMESLQTLSSFFAKYLLDIAGRCHQPAEYDISLLTLTDVSFEAAASATGSGNAAQTYDIDKFVFSTVNDAGNLTAKQAIVTVANKGGSIAAENSNQTDLSDDTALAETTILSSISASGSSQIVAASAAQTRPFKSKQMRFCKPAQIWLES